MMSVSVDLQVTSDVEVPEEASLAALTGLVRHVLDSEGASGAWSMVIQFTSDSEIQRLHRDFMGIDEPTDIMTFPYDGSDEAFPGVMDEVTGGDVVISVDSARANAGTAGWSTGEEVLFLVTHGVLHLVGWNDHTDPERDAMLDRQHELLRAWKRGPREP